MALVERDAAGPAHGPAVVQARRHSTVGRRLALARVELLRDPAQVVHRIDARLVAQRGAGRPSGVERVERALHLDRFLVAIAVVGELRGQLPMVGIEVRVLVLERAGLAVDVLLVGEREPGAGAEQVLLLEPDPGLVRPALAAEAELRLQRPGVLGQHLEVDLAVGIADRPYAGIRQVAIAAQASLRFLERAGLVSIAGAKQQLRRDGGLARDDVDMVHDPKEQEVLFRDGGVEDVEPNQAHLADHGAGGFERRVVRHAGRAHDGAFRQARARAGQQPRAGSGQAGQQGKQAGDQRGARAFHRLHGPVLPAGEVPATCITSVTYST